MLSTQCRAQHLVLFICRSGKLCFSSSTNDVSEFSPKSQINSFGIITLLCHPSPIFPAHGCLRGPTFSEHLPSRKAQGPHRKLPPTHKVALPISCPGPEPHSPLCLASPHICLLPTRFGLLDYSCHFQALTGGLSLVDSPILAQTYMLLHSSAQTDPGGTLLSKRKFSHQPPIGDINQETTAYPYTPAYVSLK